MRPYHETLAALGYGDLHPGGAASTTRLLGWLGPWAGGRILEIGAGAGWTTRRLVRAGWTVHAVEPSPVLAAGLRNVAALVSAAGIETVAGAAVPESYDAVIAESVLYDRLTADLAGALRRLLRPGGALALSDLLWTDAAPPDTAAELSDRSLAEFGLRIAPRERIRWDDRIELLERSGFRIDRLEPVASDGSGGASRSGPVRRLVSAVRRPGAVRDLLRYRRRERRLRVPDGWLDGRLALAVARP